MNTVVQKSWMIKCDKIQIIFKQIWFIDGAQTGITILGQSRSGSNGNEGVYYTP